jgi:asparagine synthetase B (glutamine-hydrolysing)
MCGIIACIHAEGTPEAVRRRILGASLRLRHRGPDSSACWQSVHGGDAISFERLQIIDPSATGG